MSNTTLENAVQAAGYGGIVRLHGRHGHTDYWVTNRTGRTVELCPDGGTGQVRRFSSALGQSEHWQALFDQTGTDLTAVAEAPAEVATPATFDPNYVHDTAQAAMETAGVGGVVSSVESCREYDVEAHEGGRLFIRSRTDRDRTINSPAAGAGWRVVALAPVTEAPAAEPVLTEIPGAERQRGQLGTAADQAGVGGTVGWHGWGEPFEVEPRTVFRIDSASGNNSWQLTGIAGSENGVTNTFYRDHGDRRGSWSAIARMVAPAAEAEAETEAETEAKAPVFVSVDGLAVGLRFVLTEAAARHYGLHTDLCYRSGVVTELYSDSRETRVRWTDETNRSRSLWVYRPSTGYEQSGEIFELIDPPTAEELAAWCIAEAQHKIVVAQQNAQIQNDALSELVMTERNRANNAMNIARDEIAAEVTKLRTEHAELTELANMFKPGGLANRIACMRGDLTSQCSELDRTLRGIGFYDRDGYDRDGRRSGKQLAEAEQFGRDWYKNKFHVPVTAVGQRDRESARVTVNLKVLSTGANAYDALRHVNYDRVHAAMIDALGWSQLYDLTYDVGQESEVEADLNNYDVSAFTD